MKISATADQEYSAKIAQSKYLAQKWSRAERVLERRRAKNCQNRVRIGQNQAKIGPKRVFSGFSSSAL